MRYIEIINAATNSKNIIIAYYDARASKGNMPAGRWTPGARTLSRRHLKSCKRSVQIVIKRFHDLEKFCCFCDKCFCIAQVLVLDRIFQIPALIFQIFCLRVFFLIACRDISHSFPFWAIKSRIMVVASLNMSANKPPPKKDWLPGFIIR